MAEYQYNRIDDNDLNTLYKLQVLEKYFINRYLNSKDFEGIKDWTIKKLPLYINNNNKNIHINLLNKFNIILEEIEYKELI